MNKENIQRANAITYAANAASWPGVKSGVGISMVVDIVNKKSVFLLLHRNYIIILTIFRIFFESVRAMALFKAVLEWRGALAALPARLNSIDGRTWFKYYNCKLRYELVFCSFQSNLTLRFQCSTPQYMLLSSQVCEKACEYHQHFQGNRRTWRMTCILASFYWRGTPHSWQRHISG